MVTGTQPAVTRSLPISLSTEADRAHRHRVDQRGRLPTIAAAFSPNSVAVALYSAHITIPTRGQPRYAAAIDLADTCRGTYSGGAAAVRRAAQAA